MKNKIVFQIIIAIIIATGCRHYPPHINTEQRDRLLTEYDLGLKYILDTITIKDPRIAVFNETVYIVAGKYQDEFADSPHCQEGKHIFRIPPIFVREDLCDISPLNETDFTRRAYHTWSFGDCLYRTSYDVYNVVFDKKIGEIEYYRFLFSPRRFLLELIWYNPRRYSDSFPYGPNWFVTFSEAHKDSTFVHRNKLDSLESCIPSFPLLDEEPHYILTVEPLFSRETVNEYIEWNQEYEAPPYKKRLYRRYAFPDFG